MQKKALLSVFDKSGLEDLARGLLVANYEIISTGGTAKFLKEKGITCRDISDLTGFPEILGGRVKTLHPKVFGGVLFRRNDSQHQQEIKENNLESIDLVCVNLYPFLEKVVTNISFDEKVEFIDIGGPSMLRAAAKNFPDVINLTSPVDYHWVIKKISQGEEITLSERKLLAKKIFELTSKYDSHVASFLGSDKLFIQSDHKSNLRYGENPDEEAQIFYTKGEGIAKGEILQGKEMSYNNFLDGDSAWKLVQEFEDPACAIIKHRNPCGVALGANPLEALKKALKTDSQSAFGGIFAINRECTANLATELQNFFFEVFIAPGFNQEAREIFSKKKNLRLLSMDSYRKSEEIQEIHSIGGGLLKKIVKNEPLNFKKVSREEDEISELDLEFAYLVSKHTISNAIVITKDKSTISICGGQTSRVGAVQIALEKAGDKARGATLASDGFFPFADSMDLLHQYGISTCIAPGGSIRDREVIEAADRYGISFFHADRRVFKH